MTLMHLRAKDADGNILPHGGITIVARENGGKTVDLAAAVCSPDDNFCRKAGRAIALGRLESAKSKLVVNAVQVPLDRPIADLIVTFAGIVAEHNRHADWLVGYVVQPAKVDVERRARCRE